MFLLQNVLDVIHLLQNAFAFALNVSYFAGRGIFLALVHIFSWIRDFFAVLVVIGEELYRFISELNDSIEAVFDYVHKSTNCSINSTFEAIGIFLQKITQFSSSTRLYSRLLATRAGTFVVSLVVLVRDALVLLADCFWWLLTIIPRTLVHLLIIAGDGIVFGISAAGRLVASTVRLLLDDIFRLTIGAVLLFLLIRHRTRLILFIIRCLLRLARHLRSLVHRINMQWTHLQSRWRRRPIPAALNANDRRIRRSPLPRSNALLHASDRALREKVPESQICVICRDQPKSVLLLPCKHLCLCEECADYMILTANQHQCPLCRAAVAHSMSVYA